MKSQSLRVARWGAAFLIAFSSVAGAQSPLPVELSSRFTRNGPSATHFVYSAQHENLPVLARVRLYNNGPQGGTPAWNIKLRWSASVGTIDGHYIYKTHNTPFQPTAASRADDKTNIIYVAGWIESSGEVVIEKWKFKSSLAQPGSTKFPAPQLIRTELLRCGSIQPLSDLVCNPNGNELWLLEWAYNSPKRLLCLDLNDISSDCSDPYKIFYDGSDPADVAAYPLMDGLRSIFAGTHPAAGWIVYFEKRPKWDSPTNYKEPYDMMVGIDSSLSGTLNFLGPMTYFDLFTSYPYSEWNNVH